MVTTRFSVLANVHQVPKSDEVNEAPISSSENLADNGSIRFQIHNHFRPSDPADKSVHVARLVVLRIGHELNAAIVEATHPGPQYTLARLGFQAFSHRTARPRAESSR